MKFWQLSDRRDLKLIPEIDIFFSQKNVTYNTENIIYPGSKQNLVRVQDRSDPHDIKVSSR
jgi:hypothetical protein